MPAVSSCLCSATAWERAETDPDSDEMSVEDDIGLLSRAGTSFCQVSVMSLPPVSTIESHMDIHEAVAPALHLSGHFG